MYGCVIETNEEKDAKVKSGVMYSNFQLIFKTTAFLMFRFETQALKKTHNQIISFCF